MLAALHIAATLPPNVVTLDRTRITVLTDQLLRIEQRGAGGTGGSGYDDRPTLSFPFRSAAPPVNFTIARPSAHQLELQTAALTLQLDESKLAPSGLTPAALTIEYSPAGSERATWHFGDADPSNLLGTRHSLDCYTAVEVCLAPDLMEAGLLSRSGAVLWDDTHRGRYDSPNVSTGWISQVPSTSWAGAGYRDYSFFGHGRRFLAALQDYTVVGGAPELPPTSSLGVWWSRYQNYSQDVFIEQVLDGYADHALPLGQVVMDVDWHTRPGHNSPPVDGCDGYGGFVWNSELFPDPVAWVNSMHSDSNPIGHHLTVLLNLHLDRGVDHCQPSYKAIATAIGAQPNGTALSCDIENRKWTEALFEHALGQPGKPTATQAGADAWWTDYSGCPKVCIAPACHDKPCAAVDQSNCSSSMLWSNLIFARHQTLAGNRPLVLSRWGGLGGHRAPVGFSGDSHACWATLQYQISFTSTAANVLQTWSHDLGGFYAFDDGDPTNVTGSELLLRWLQFGAVSPVFRTHCSGMYDGPHCIRRIWLFPHFEHMKAALVLRDDLLPYLTTAYRTFHDTGVGVVHPCYYEHPEEEEAYATRGAQYRFGSEVLAAPITKAAAADPLNGSVSQSVWIPPGSWVDWRGVESVVGPTNHTRSYSHAEIPLFVRYGAALPMKLRSASSQDLKWVLFVGGGAAGSGTVYDDAGQGHGYKEEEWASTQLRYTAAWRAGGHVELKISPGHRCAGGCSRWAAMRRAHAIELRGLSALGLSVGRVVCNGEALPQTTGGRGVVEPAVALLPQRWMITDEVSIRIDLEGSA
jgi:alpha-glucosidase